MSARLSIDRSLWLFRALSLSILVIIGVLILSLLSNTDVYSSTDQKRPSERHLERKIEQARLYGSIHGYAYYFVDLLVGSPIPQRQSVILDTGSTILAFPCKSCKTCGSHLDNPFVFDESGTAEWQKCQGGCLCRDNKCAYYQAYTEGSRIAGHWFTDYVRIGDVQRQNDAVKMHVGCHDTETNLFRSQKANGIAGVGPRRQSEYETLIDALFSEQKGGVDPKVFSICLSPLGGMLTIGGYDTSFHRDFSTPSPKGAQPPNPVYTPLVDHSYYSVSLLEGSLEGEVIGRAGEWGRSIIVDSGTTFTYFPPVIYRRIKSHFDSFCKKGNCKGTSREVSGDECWDVEKIEDLKTFPTMKLLFRGDAEVTWYPHSYLYQRHPSLTFCLAIDDNVKDDTVLGMSFMIQRDVIFDLANDRVGFADAECPSFTDRPPPPEHKSMPLYPKEHLFDTTTVSPSEASDSSGVTTAGPGTGSPSQPIPHEPPNIPIDKEKSNDPSTIDASVLGSPENIPSESAYPTPPPLSESTKRSGDQMAGGTGTDEVTLGTKIGVWITVVGGILLILAVAIVIVCQNVKGKRVAYETMNSQLEEEEEALKEIQLSSFRGGYSGDAGFELDEDEDDDDEADEDDFDEDSDHEYSSDSDIEDPRFSTSPQKIGKR